jgi:uncharacterized protein YwgA
MREVQAMNVEKKWLDRSGLIAALVEKTPDQTLSRTAVMKLAYFLQVLEKVPLGYDFRLHTFGPYDPDVLDDLAYAGVLGAIKERIVTQAGGYRYEIRPGRHCAKAQIEAKSLIEQNRGAIDGVVREFGSLSASDLELYSTIVFADRENHKAGKTVLLEELAKQVQAIKPRFPESYVLRVCRTVSEKGLLQAISNSQE